MSNLYPRKITTALNTKQVSHSSKDDITRTLQAKITSIRKLRNASDDFGGLSADEKERSSKDLLMENNWVICATAIISIEMLICSEWRILPALIKSSPN